MKAITLISGVGSTWIEPAQSVQSNEWLNQLNAHLLFVTQSDGERHEIGEYE